MLCVQARLKIRSTDDNTSMPKVKDPTVIIVWRPNQSGLGFGEVIAMLIRIRNKYDD